MRKMLILFLALGALASIALCASYGWDLATETKDKATQAFIFGFVAGVTLALHALAVRLWSEGKKAAGAFAGCVGVLAFVMTAFTSLGGMATRSDKVIAERQGALENKADAKRQIEALEQERAGLRYVRTTSATVAAAKRLADAATAAQKAECGNGDPRFRGKNCRQKETAEAAAISALAKAEADKAATDRAEEIDSALKVLRTGTAQPNVAAADPMNALLSKIIGAWASVVTAWQKAVFAVIYDLCLVALMIGIEAGGRTSRARHAEGEAIGHPVTHKPDTRALQQLAPPLDARAIAVEAVTVEAAPDAGPAAPEPAEAARRLTQRPRPRLAASTKQPVGAPLDFLHSGLDIMDNARTEMTDLFFGYVGWCKGAGLRAMSPGPFAVELERICREVGIRVEQEGAMVFVYCVQVRTEPTATQA